MKLDSYYKRYVLGRPRAIVLIFIFLVIFSAYHSFDFELDASGESLLLENDKSLEYYREISQKYASDDFVIITFKPNNNIFSKQSIETIKAIRNGLLELENIEKVNSILDVPIVYESGLRLSEIKGNLKTLSDEETDINLIRKEFSSNPLYQELLVSKDKKITAIQALFKQESEYYEKTAERQRLQSKSYDLSKEEKDRLELLNKEIKEINKRITKKRNTDIQHIRTILKKYQHAGQLHLGGIPLITVDMIQFIKNDLLVFGTGVIILLVVILTLFFHRLEWVFLPMMTCAVSGIIVMGLLGYLSWAITVISSNFLSILLIITLSLTIHLIVRYRDLQQQDPGLTHEELVESTIRSMVRPCFYTIITTAVAFASLVVSEIRPVIDFGWIMVIGLGIAFITCFTLLPIMLNRLKITERSSGKDRTRKITSYLAGIVHRHTIGIILISFSFSILMGLGINKLEVENRFINNFKSHTEIYQGMKVIDDQLGGTMPLDIIIDPDEEFTEIISELATEENELDDLFIDESQEAEEVSYWLNPNMIDKARHIHQHLETYSVIGKVTSIVTSMDIIEKLNGAPFDEFELALLKKRIPDDIANDMVVPYLSEDNNQIRINMRIIESDPDLNRNELLKSIKDYLITEVKLDEEQINLTGMMVLYNNMLQSLYQSQIQTIGTVFFAIFIMFLILFRNLVLALIAIIPNIFSAVVILGLMGWLKIPLDMMTITIAAITIGISVDDTIHYIHRFQHELPVDNHYENAIMRCHGGIGKAMYYTSITIFFGFALLSLSNFIPTIYFGLLTGLAMLMALVGDLLLLPAIILILKPRIN